MGAVGVQFKVPPHPADIALGEKPYARPDDLPKSSMPQSPFGAG
jgi:hypothetical protein